jgi:hypothetical protein
MTEARPGGRSHPYAGLHEADRMELTDISFARDRTQAAAGPGLWRALRLPQARPVSARSIAPSGHSR